MPNYEYHIIVGHVGGSVIMRYTDKGVAVASFSVAVNDRNKKDAPPTWYRVTCWRALAEFVHDHVERGAPVMVTGERLSLSKWESKSGEQRFTLELTARDVVLLPRRGDDQAAPSDSDDYFEEPEMPF